MSDDMSIPSPAYRMPQQRGGMDPALRRVMIYAGGLVAAGLVIGGVSMLFNRQSSGPVPVVSADPRPLRVKPENPGGMQIAGWRADRAADHDQPGKLGPGPETPDPSLLQAAPSTPIVEVPDAAAPRAGGAARSGSAAAPDGAASRTGPTAAPDGARTGSTVGRSQPDPATRAAAPPAQAASQIPAPPSQAAGVAPQGKTPPAPTPVPTVTTLAPRTATALAPPAGARPVPAPTPVAPTAQTSSPQPGTLALPGGKSAQPQAAPQQVALATPPKSAAPAVKPVSVQLAALLTEDAAKAEWQQMERRMPEVLGGHSPNFSRFERDGRTYWRVRVSGFGDLQQAKTFCERVRGKNASCSVADF